MEQSPFTWEQILSFVQALIVPAIWYLARVLSRLSERMDAVEKDQVRTNALLEARQSQRVEDRDETKSAIAALQSSIEKLREAIERALHPPK